MFPLKLTAFWPNVKDNCYLLNNLQYVSRCNFMYHKRNLGKDFYI